LQNNNSCTKMTYTPKLSSIPSIKKIIINNDLASTPKKDIR
ncbi:10156_t:CDS:1, partial [Diversispora eburnea]